jgi:hypothetical protein
MCSVMFANRGAACGRMLLVMRGLGTSLQCLAWLWRGSGCNSRRFAFCPGAAVRRPCAKPTLLALIRGYIGIDKRTFGNRFAPFFIVAILHCAHCNQRAPAHPRNNAAMELKMCRWRRAVRTASACVRKQELFNVNGCMTPFKLLLVLVRNVYFRSPFSCSIFPFALALVVGHTNELRPWAVSRPPLARHGIQGRGGRSWHNTRVHGTGVDGGDTVAAAYISLSQFFWHFRLRWHHPGGKKMY